MDAVTLLTDKTNNHRLMQIDLDIVANNVEMLEDICDLLTIEVRKNEETLPWGKAKGLLKKNGDK